MISEKIQKALNEQLNKELYSSYLYLAMSAYFERINHTGMAKWMKMQSDEEHIHAMKFYDFIIRIGGNIQLEKIECPPSDWESPQIAFEEAYNHEVFISKSINSIADLAVEEKDHSTNTFLHWFIDEQVEEEATALEIVENFKMIGDSTGGLFMLDRELGRRQIAQGTNN